MSGRQRVQATANEPSEPTAKTALERMRYERSVLAANTARLSEELDKLIHGSKDNVPAKS